MHTVLVSPRTPCFAALYAALYGLATVACIEPVLIILPNRFSIMYGRLNFVSSQVDLRIVSTILSYSAVGQSWMGATNWQPALFTRTWRRIEARVREVFRGAGG